jgi:hypothetical protein
MSFYLSPHILDGIGLFILLAGFIVGLGAVTVIDIHGFLGRKSSYWTEATIRTHKVTKILIWIGIFFVILGGSIFYRNESFLGIPLVHSFITLILIINGLFLSLKVSPFLLKREREGREKELLPLSLQKKITLSFIVSFVGWWGSLLLLVMYILQLV